MLTFLYSHLLTLLTLTSVNLATPKISKYIISPVKLPPGIVNSRSKSKSRDIVGEREGGRFCSLLNTEGKTLRLRNSL